MTTTPNTDQTSTDRIHDVLVAEARMNLAISNLKFEIENLRSTEGWSSNTSIADRLEITVGILGMGGDTENPY